METTKNLKLTYQLSAAGQKLAVLSGRPAQAGSINEIIQISDEDIAAYIDLLHINSAGEIELQVMGGNKYNMLMLDQPPTMQSAIAAMEASREEYKQRQAAERAKEEQEKADRDARIRGNSAFVQAILVAAESSCPDLSDMPKDVDGRDFLLLLHSREIYSGGAKVELTPEHQAQISFLHQRSQKYKAEQEKAAQQQKEEAISAIVAQHGGYYWPSAAQCDFKGYQIWRNGQTKRWVGIFTEMRGISTFLNSPRGEHVFDALNLRRGDCVQAAGYDTNSRGKRRNESEWFGVVIANDDAGLVILEQPTRGACFVAAKNLK